MGQFICVQLEVPLSVINRVNIFLRGSYLGYLKQTKHGKSQHTALEWTEIHFCFKSVSMNSHDGPLVLSCLFCCC